MKPVRFPILLLALFASANLVKADDCCTPASTCCPRDLVKLSYDELECLYRTLTPTEIPGGFYRGTVITKSPKLARRACADVTRFVWQGKWICPEQALMINEVMGKPKVTAAMSMGESWLDDGSALIFDYACSSAKFARSARDEVRQVCPGLYLGIMWIRQDCGECPKLSTFFLLESTATCCE